MARPKLPMEVAYRRARLLRWLANPDVAPEYIGREARLLFRDIRLAEEGKLPSQAVHSDEQVAEPIEVARPAEKPEPAKVRVHQPVARPKPETPRTEPVAKKVMDYTFRCPQCNFPMRYEQDGNVRLYDCIKCKHELIKEVAA